MTSESTLELALRAVLAEQRPANGASAGLQERVAGIPETTGQRPWLVAASARWLAPLAATLVTAAAVLAAVFIAGRGPATVLPPAGGSTPPAATFDPNLEGPGILRSLDTTLSWVPGIFVVLALIAVLYLLSSRRFRRVRLALVLTALASVAIAGAMLSTFHGIGHGSAYAILRGFDVQVPNTPGFEGFGEFFETAGPGDHTVVMFSVRNESAIPVTVEGVLVEPPTSDSFPTWSAVWLPKDGAEGISDLDRIRPFTPTTIQPGDELDLYLVGKPGRCAYGPAFTLESPIAGSYGMAGEARVIWSVFGLRTFSLVRIGLDANEPIREGCVADV